MREQSPFGRRDLGAGLLDRDPRRANRALQNDGFDQRDSGDIVKKEILVVFFIRRLLAGHVFALL